MAFQHIKGPIEEGAKHIFISYVFASYFKKPN